MAITSIKAHLSVLKNIVTYPLSGKEGFTSALATLFKIPLLQLPFLRTWICFVKTEQKLLEQLMLLNNDCKDVTNQVSAITFFGKVIMLCHRLQGQYTWRQSLQKAFD